MQNDEKVIYSLRLVSGKEAILSYERWHVLTVKSAVSGDVEAFVS